MFKSFRIGKIGGFPIWMDLSFLLLAGLFAFQNFGDTAEANLASLLKIPILFLAITIHELGHAWAIRRLGYGKSTILLWGMGGLCKNRATYTSKHGLQIALAGPFAGSLMGFPALAALFLIPGLPGWLGSVLSFTCFVTLGWTLFNLLPIYSLDGGQALMYALRFKGGKSRHEATRIAGLVGLITLAIASYFLITWGGGLWTLLILFYLGMDSWKAWRDGTRVRGRG